MQKDNALVSPHFFFSRPNCVMPPFCEQIILKSKKGVLFPTQLMQTYASQNPAQKAPGIDQNFQWMECRMVPPVKDPQRIDAVQGPNPLFQVWHGNSSDREMGGENKLYALTSCLCLRILIWDTCTYQEKLMLQETKGIQVTQITVFLEILHQTIDIEKENVSPCFFLKNNAALEHCNERRNLRLDTSCTLLQNMIWIVCVSRGLFQIGSKGQNISWTISHDIFLNLINVASTNH